MVRAMLNTARHITILILILFSGSGVALDYYVSPTGNADWADCTNESTPCSGRTAAENAVAGDIVYLRGGTYDPAADPVQEWSSKSDSLKYETLPWNPQHSGLPNQPITFRAYPGEIPVFLDNEWGGAFGAAFRDYIVWDGISAQIVNQSGNTIALAVFYNADNCALINSNLSGILKETHHNSALVRLDYTNGILIENNLIHGMNSYAPSDSEYQELANNSAGILSFYSRNLIVKNNDIYNNYLGIFDKDTEQNNVYFNNHIWGGDTAHTMCQTGIQINDQRSEYGSTSGTKAYQNIVRNCEIAISIYDGVGTNNHVEIYNNSLLAQNSGDTGILVTESSNGAEIYNNIFYDFNYFVRYYSPVSSTVSVSNYNLFYGSSFNWRINYQGTNYTSLTDWQGDTGLDQNSIVGDPLFINSSGDYPADFHLSTGSDALGNGQGGLNIGAFPTDSSPSVGYYTLRPKPPFIN